MCEETLDRPPAGLFAVMAGRTLVMTKPAPPSFAEAR